MVGERMSTDSPNLLLAGWSMLRAMRVRRPRPAGDGAVDHAELAGVLDVLATEGVPGLAAQRPAIADYVARLAAVDPDELSRDEALAYWLNLYNAGALDLAARTAARGDSSVLRVPGAFSRPWTAVAGEDLSLDDIEHGKVRRFGDPRIHAALVCGSASCPTLRYEPYAGSAVDKQLEDQMRAFLAGGAARYDEATQRLELSRIFKWYGADFVRSHRMPAWLPASKRAVATAIQPWLDADLSRVAGTADIGFQSYDWTLVCSIR
jgi:hypothetical protein